MALFPEVFFSKAKTSLGLLKSFQARLNGTDRVSRFFNVKQDLYWVKDFKALL
jgi:hypothetical protein